MSLTIKIKPPSLITDVPSGQFSMLYQCTKVDLVKLKLYPSTVHRLLESFSFTFWIISFLNSQVCNSQYFSKTYLTTFFSHSFDDRHFRIHSRQNGWLQLVSMPNFCSLGLVFSSTTSIQMLQVTPLLLWMAKDSCIDTSWFLIHSFLRRERIADNYKDSLTETVQPAV